MTKSQKRGLTTTVQSEPDFSRTCSFHEVLGTNEDCFNRKFHRNRWSRFRDMDKKHQKCIKNGFFPPFVTPQIKALVTTEQPKAEFSRTCGFREVLGINEDCSNAKFHQNP